MTCPRCSGFMASYHADARCLNCGHRPPDFTPDPKPVLDLLRCVRCPRDRERDSEFCRQCGPNRKKKGWLKKQCRSGHVYAEGTYRVVEKNGGQERRCILCERNYSQAARDRKKGAAA